MSEEVNRGGEQIDDTAQVVEKQADMQGFLLKIATGGITV